MPEGNCDFRPSFKKLLVNLGFRPANQLFAIALLGSILSYGSTAAAENSFIITTEEWPPFISSELPENGWAMEVARAALEPQGYDVTLQLVPWARAVRCVESGACDGLYLS